MLRMTQHLAARCTPVSDVPVRGPSVTMDPDTGLITVEVEIVVARPVDEVAKAIDPPHWDDGSRFFRGDGARLISRTQAQCLAAERSDCGEIREVDPPTDEYDWAVLYEHFHASDDSGLDSTFTNLLWVNPDWITTPQGPRMYVVAYTLYAALEGRVGSVQGVRILRDDGELSAKPLGAARARVRMRKRVRFESQWANVATYVGFKSAQNDLGKQFNETATATVRPDTGQAN
jgi:hypothetical protein